MRCQALTAGTAEARPWPVGAVAGGTARFERLSALVAKFGTISIGMVAGQAQHGFPPVA